MPISIGDSVFVGGKGQGLCSSFGPMVGGTLVLRVAGGDQGVSSMFQMQLVAQLIGPQGERRKTSPVQIAW